METINQDQLTFFSFKYISNNIFLTRETISWVKKPIFNKQSIVFLKLGFSKAYDKVDWDFFFQVYEKAWNSR
jgi:hypothetical protein